MPRTKTNWADLQKLARFFLLVGFGLAFQTGCNSTDSTSGQPTSGLNPSPHHRVGEIVNLDPSSATVVVRLDRKNTSLAEELMVRNAYRETVALLQPTGIRTGNSVGMVVLRGEPQRGQEVVQPGNEP